MRPHTGEHALLDHVCAPLTVATAGRIPPHRFRELAALLRLLRDYVAAAADPSVVSTVLECAGASLLHIQVRAPRCGPSFTISLCPKTQRRRPRPADRGRVSWRVRWRPD